MPFAHLARAGFVAVTLLKEAVNSNLLSETAKDEFMETLETVSHELSLDAWKTSKGEKTWEEFVETYGHLRPGTYDITSLAYWDDSEKYLRPLLKQAIKPKDSSKNISNWEKEKISFFGNLREIGLDFKDNEFEEFLKLAIEGREKSKFIFTRSLSVAISLIEKIAKKYDLNKNELANLEYFELLSAFKSDLPKHILSKQLKDKAKHNIYERNVSLACQLPPLITSKYDFEYFVLKEDKPNFIGNQTISANVVLIEDSKNNEMNLEGCIVLIPQADPGYDWLFGQKIAGLITMYGGANSHMAIRSAEFGLPAAIGIGVQLYNKYKLANYLELDPSGQTIRIIR